MTLCYFNVETVLSEAVKLWDFCSELLVDLSAHKSRNSSTYLTQSTSMGMLATNPVYNVILGCDCSHQAEKVYEIIKTFNEKDSVKVDFLLYGNFSIYMTDWQIPFPGLTKRAYILCPLLELDPNFVFPDGERILDKVSKLEDDEVTATKIFEVTKTHIDEKSL